MQDLAASLNTLLRRWQEVDPDRPERPFHLALLAYLSQQGQVETPKASQEDIAEYMSVLKSDELFQTREDKEAALGRIIEDLRKDLLLPYGPYPEIQVVVCRTKRVDARGRLLGCCTKEEQLNGCDAGAGTTYYAKTDGRRIVFAGLMASEKAREARLAILGVEVPSLTLFTTLHEFGHVLWINRNTRYQFDEAKKFYEKAVSVVDSKVVEEANVALGDSDYAEFVASLFALNSIGF